MKIKVVFIHQMDQEIQRKLFSFAYLLKFRFYIVMCGHVCNEMKTFRLNISVNPGLRIMAAKGYF